MSKEFYKLTHPQIGIWNVELFHQKTPVNNIVGTVKYEKDVDISLLEKAINKLIEKNDALRLRIIEKDGQPMQYITDYKYENIRVLDFTGFTDEEEEKAINEEVQKTFNLIDSKLYDFAILIYNDGNKGVYYKGHHLITDAWSIIKVCSRLTKNYSILANNEDDSNFEQSTYIDFINRETEYKSSKRFEKDREYWLKKFETFPEFTELKPYNDERASLKVERNIYKLPKALTRIFHEYCAKHGVSPYTMLMSTLVAYLARITQKEDITIGTPILNRCGIKERETLGMFISVSPLRVNVNMEVSFGEHISIVEKELKGLIMHQAYPYDMMLSDFRNIHETSDKLYDVVFSYQNAKFEIPEQLPYETKWWSNRHETNSITIHASDRESDGQLIIEIDYLKQLFTSAEIDCIFKHMFNLLGSAILHSDKKVYELEILTKVEKKELLYKFNNSYVDYPRDKVVHQLFEKQVEKIPDNIALVVDDKTMTYKELNNRANQLARVLRNKGVGPDKLVGIMVRRSLEMIVGILAILKAGGAYVPIDPEYPEERIKYMLEDADVSILLTQRQFENKVEYKDEKLFIELNEPIYNGDTSNLDIVNKPNDLAYVIYTSGSTGQPKGVMIEHSNLVNFIYTMLTKYDYDITKKDVFLSLTNLSFDVSVAEIFTALVNGAKLVIYKNIFPLDIYKLADCVEANGVTFIYIPPSLLEHFYDLIKVKNNIKLNKMLVGVEPIKFGVIKKYYTINKNMIILNGYGPTENTICCSMSICKKKQNDKENISIGKPVNNSQIYILDKYKNLLPKGINGSIYVSGNCVFRGYIKNQEKTNKVLEKINDRLLYRTGDIGFIDKVGELNYVGREDNQIKLNGYRIELGEIESKIKEVEGVKNSIVICVNKKIHAYLVLEKNKKLENVKKQLRDYLPLYMLPNYYIVLDKFPLTANGKIDRKALVKLYSEQSAKKQKSIGKVSNEAKKLIKVWENVLKIKNIHIDDDFFELGGNSLGVMEAVAKMKRLGFTVDIQDVYNYRTINSLLKHIKGKSSKDIDYEKENIVYLNNQEYSNIKIDEELGNVFLTGVTGYLGIHLLIELLKNTSSKIYCLVRGNNLEDSIQRFNKYFNHFAKNISIRDINERIVLLNGDISKEKFGIEDKAYNEIGKKIKTVIHSAGNVNYFADYKNSYSTNVVGTSNILDFCKTYNLNLNYISTLSVSGQHVVSIKKIKDVFDENELYIGQKYKENPYVRSKYEAEKLVIEAIKNGIEAKIYRVGSIVHRSYDKIFQMEPQNNMVNIKLNAVKKLGILPKDFLDFKLEALPVDLCAEQIVKISRTFSNQKIFHIYKPYNLEKLIKLFVGSMEGIEILSGRAFNKRIAELKNEGKMDDDAEMIFDFYKKNTKAKRKKDIKVKNTISAKYLRRVEELIGKNEKPIR